MNECPHCGDEYGYQESTPCRGVYVRSVGFDGSQMGGDYSVEYGDEPKTVTCMACEKRFPNPELDKNNDKE